jgi:hypothetical protein
MFSYANVPLPLPPPDVLSRVRRHLSYDYLRLWDDLPGTPARPLQALPVRAWDPWPVRDPQALPSRPWLSAGPLRLNTLLWPSGASRWSVFHAIVDDAAMDKIRGATGSFGQPLVIEDGGDVALSLTMYPLPPRPLSQIPGANGFSLLTLLDRRAYWPWLSAEIDVVGGTTTWADLFDAIASALGVTLDVDPVPAAYLSPPAALSSAYDSLPALLDAACLSCGLRFAAALDGTSYRCWSVAAAQTQVAANLAGVTNPRVAGGLFLQGTDLNGILPAAVQVVFPRADDGTPNSAPVVVPVTLASLNLPSNPPGGPAVGGIGGLTKTFHSSAVATYSGGSPTNSGALAALATRAATDWYAWQATGVYDVAYAGVAPWLPTGADGLVEYAHAPDQGAGGGILSRFRRDAYFDQQEALWHHTVTPCAAIPTRVRVVGTTLTDTCLYAAELVMRSGCADVAVSPPVAVWLRLDGGTVPGAGDVHLGSPEGVRPADGLPVYVAVVSGAAASPPFAAHTVRGISNILADADVQQMGNNYKGFDGAFLNNPADAAPGNLTPSLQMYADADPAQAIGNTVAVGTGATFAFDAGAATGTGFNQPAIPFSKRGGLATPLLAFTHINNPPVAAGSLAETVYITSQQGGGSAGIILMYRDGSLNYNTVALITQAQAAFYAPVYGTAFGTADPVTGALTLGIASTQITGVIGGGTF